MVGRPAVLALWQVVVFDRFDSKALTANPISESTARSAGDWSVAGGNPYP